MAKVIKGVLEKQGYNNIKNRLLISLAILIIAIIIFLGYIMFMIPKQCNDSNCYANALSKCSRVSYIRQDTNAAWLYTINGASGKDSCKLTVRLLRMNQGTIDSENLQGAEMLCIVNKYSSMPPENNMLSCSGILKEKLQEIIIDRMHSYLLKNLGEINENFLP